MKTTRRDELGQAVLSAIYAEKIDVKFTRIAYEYNKGNLDRSCFDIIIFAFWRKLKKEVLTLPTILKITNGVNGYHRKW